MSEPEPKELVNWILLALTVSGILIKFGEWRKSVSSRRSRDESDRDPVRLTDPGAHHVTLDQLELKLQRHLDDCDARARDQMAQMETRIVERVVAENTRLVERLTANEHRTDARLAAVEVETRKNRDWLIEAQAHLGLRRKERS